MYQILLTITMAQLEYFSQKVAGIGCLHKRPVCVPSKIVVLTGYVSSAPNIARLNTPRAQTSPDYGLVPPKVIPAAVVVAVHCEICLCPKLISAQFQFALILHNHTRQSAARSFGGVRRAMRRSYACTNDARLAS